MALFVPMATKPRWVGDKGHDSGWIHGQSINALSMAGSLKKNDFFCGFPLKETVNKNNLADIDQSFPLIQTATVIQLVQGDIYRTYWFVLQNPFRKAIKSIPIETHRFYSNVYQILVKLVMHFFYWNSAYINQC